MDVIFIKKLCVNTKIGVYPWEKISYCKILIDLEMGYDITIASESDKLFDTIDYQLVIKKIREFAKLNNSCLLENFAGKIIKILFKEFNFIWVKLTLKKLNPLPNITYEVGITMERTASNYISII